MTTVGKNRSTTEFAGYEVVATFPLLASAWWDDYYTPMIDRLDGLQLRAVGNPEEEALIALTEREIFVHREHAAEYGYALFILPKAG